MTKVVVVLVEAVAREADVVNVSGFAVRATDAAVLHEDRDLLFGRELLERAGSAQRIPDRPRRASDPARA